MTGILGGTAATKRALIKALHLQHPANHVFFLIKIHISVSQSVFMQSYEPTKQRYRETSLSLFSGWFLG